jgi:hypothetical protein
MLFAGNNLDKAREIFAAAVKQKTRGFDLFSSSWEVWAKLCLSPAPSMPIAVTNTWSPTRSLSIWITRRSSPDRSAASHSFSFAVLSATNRRDTGDFVVARLASPARSPSGSRTERAYLRVGTPISIWLNAQRDSPLDCRPTPPDSSLTAVPADLTIDHAPAMALPLSVTLVAFATELFRISRCGHEVFLYWRAGMVRRAASLNRALNLPASVWPFSLCLEHLHQHIGQ